MAKPKTSRVKVRKRRSDKGKTHRKVKPTAIGNIGNTNAGKTTVVGACIYVLH